MLLQVLRRQSPSSGCPSPVGFTRGCLFAGDTVPDPVPSSAGSTQAEGEYNHRGSFGSDAGSGGSDSGSNADSTLSGTYGGGTGATRHARAQARTGRAPPSTADVVQLRGKLGRGAIDRVAVTPQWLLRHVAARLAAPSRCLLVLLLSHWQWRRLAPGHAPGHPEEDFVYEAPARLALQLLWPPAWVGEAMPVYILDEACSMYMLHFL